MLQPTQGHGKADDQSKLGGFISQSGRRIRVHHVDESFQACDTAEKSGRKQDQILFPSDILKHYHAEYLSMSQPVPLKPRPAKISHLGTSEMPRTEFDEDVAIHPHQQNKKYTVPYLDAFFSKVKKNFEHH